MPVIHIDYDNEQLSEAEIKALVKATHEIVSGVTGIADVPVYAQYPQHKYKIAPIEIFVRFSDHKIKDLDALTSEFKQKLVEWKNQEKFAHKINLTVIPMHWKIEIDIS